jgi:hypothetical protein
LPNTHLPIWDSNKSSIRSPFVLFEGRNARLVEESEVTDRGDDKGHIFVERMDPMKIRTDPRKEVVNGELKTFYTLRNTKAGRRKSKIPELRSLSASMTTGRPTRGSIAFSPYANLLDAFANGNKDEKKRARRIFGARRGATLLAGNDENGKPFWVGSKISPVVPQAFLMAVHQGSILYMPNTGRLENQGVSGSRRQKAKVRGNPSIGWEIYNENWEVCSADEVRKMIASGDAELVAEEFL